MLKRLLTGGAFALAASLVALFAAEVVLRAAGIAYPDFFRDDPVIGRSLRPGASGWWRNEGTAWVEINSDGMRDREHAVEKPPATLRIAVLGDSYAAAFEVSQDAAFWSVIERELAGCPALAGRSVEVLNFGLGGAGTAQELLLLQDRVWKYRPDVVVLGFLTGNDVSDNSRALKGSNRAAYFVRDAKGALVLDPAFVEKRATVGVGPLHDLWLALFNRSRVLQVASEARRRAKALARRDAAAVPGAEAGVDQQIYASPSTPVWREAWSITEELLRAMIAEVRARQARFLLVSLSNAIQVHPDVGARERWASELGVPDLLLPDRRIQALAEAEGVPFLMLVPPLAEWAAANQICVHGFDDATPCAGLWNEQGHRLAGERIAETLCRAVLPEPAVAAGDRESPR